ncbi:MAG: hypothetical protein HYT16_01515 [DPANN group archaeon]|nr:hypothetical protein [DPANN group archaeon]
MVEAINAIIGSGVAVINLIPFIVKQPKYLLLTSVISLLMLLLLIYFK